MNIKRILHFLQSTLAAALALLLFISFTAISQNNDSSLLKEKMLNQLRDIGTNLNGIMGIAAKDLISGEEILLNENLIFPQASAIKIPILIELYKQAEAGKIDLNKKLVLEKKVKVGGSGLLKELGDNSVEMSLRDYAVLMILVSDNTATNLIIDLVGMNNVNQSLKSWGLEKTELRRKMMDIRAAARDDENISTPREAMILLEKLYRGELLNEKHTADMIEILKKPKSTAIRKLLPSNIQIADKPGGVEAAVCCNGIVYLPHRPYVVCLMTKYLKSEEEGNEAIAHASLVVYDYFYRLSCSNSYGRRVPPSFIYK
jgi:beta-lactamase class A